IPGLRTSEYLLKRSIGEEVVREHTARQIDVEDRAAQIKKWDELNEVGQATGERPQPLVEGQRWGKVFKNPAKSVFWGNQGKQAPRRHHA
ncbi:hypothetical protein, partial [Xylella fastidiosa]|uniref:hypothetical protein n=1 Tax=Xylella fastidiosa TaxID=2371 RepID=UPI001396774C